MLENTIPELTQHEISIRTGSKQEEPVPPPHPKPPDKSNKTQTNKTIKSAKMTTKNNNKKVQP